jgi:hypothetical protein
MMTAAKDRGHGLNPSRTITVNGQEDQELLTARQLAEKLHVAERTIWRWKREGRLPFLQPAGQGGAIRFPSVCLIPRLPATPLAEPQEATPTSVGSKRLSGPTPKWMSVESQFQNCN